MYVWSDYQKKEKPLHMKKQQHRDDLIVDYDHTIYLT